MAAYRLASKSAALIRKIDSGSTTCGNERRLRSLFAIFSVAGCPRTKPARWGSVSLMVRRTDPSATEFEKYQQISASTGVVYEVDAAIRDVRTTMSATEVARTTGRSVRAGPCEQKARFLISQRSARRFKLLASVQRLRKLAEDSLHRPGSRTVRGASSQTVLPVA